MIRALRDWGPALVWAGCIFLASSIPVVPVPVGNDKVAHFAAYFVLGAALSWGGTRRALPALLAVLLGSAYGASDEVHQMFVPGRFPDLIDWLADTAGVIAGVTAGYSFFARLAPRSRTP